MSGAPPFLGDADIRPALRAKLAAQHAKQADTVLFEELGLCRGRVRVDMVVVNGALHGYEIKSDRDSLRRLRTQVDIYGKVLDRATLVVGERHLPEAVAVLPEWWGVLCIQPSVHKPRFQPVRRGRLNPGRDPRALVELLWLDDALALLEAHDAARGVRTKPRECAWDRICERFSTDEIAAAVRARLKARSRNPAPP